jgi:hypothetical protein
VAQSNSNLPNNMFLLSMVAAVVVVEAVLPQ